MVDRELVEWLVYAVVGFCALAVHTIVTAYR